MSTLKIYIGCSGFHYKEWKGIFYPDGLPQTKWFTFYCEHFNTLELNVTFYRFPTVKTLSKWYESSPEDFKFSVKAPKAITHFKKFNDCESMLDDFYNTSREGLHEKLGCILFQLPPQLIYSAELLEKIIGNLNPTFNNVLEFRHASWWNKDVIRRLKKSKITFCGISYPKLPDEVVKTNPFLYYRLHGVPVLYKSAYSQDFLQNLHEEILK
ncbi:MAG: DUF72 domain-containing protein, partial [Bacteroidota bacterium]|nr:DUF72 domain-containing protein [Bacteroidota bacterium]